MIGSACLVSDGEHQLALLAVRQHAAGLGIDDLGIEVVLPDRQPVLGLDAFLRDPGAHHLRQAVDVDRVHVELGLDRLPHRRGPGLGAENADLERRLRGVDALPLHFLGDRQHVRGRHHDDIGLEVLDQLHLLFGLAAGHRNHGAAQPFSAVVRAQAAGEQAVAVGDMDHVAGAPAGGANRARHQIRPGVDVARAYSRRPSACRWCPTRHGCARPPRAAPRTCRTDSCRAGRP